MGATADMPSWRTMIAASTAATLVTAASVFLHGVPTPRAVEALVVLHWPTLSVVWLIVYGLVTLGLAIGVEVVLGQPVAAARRRDAPLNRYGLRLIVTQYLTAVLALLGIGLTPLTVDISPTLALPPSGASLPLVAAAALAIAGLGGALAVMITHRVRKPGYSQEARDNSEPLLREILDILREERASGNNMAKVAERVEQGQRSVLAFVKEVATAVSRLRQSLDEIKRLSRDQNTTDAQTSDISPERIAEAANELRSAAAVVDAAVGKLAEVAALLSASGGVPIGGDDARAISQSRSRVSGELNDLLRQLTSTEQPGEPRQ